MSHKLLIDECLSPTLVQMALEAGHQESTRVRDRGWCGKKDWELIGVLVGVGSALSGPNRGGSVPPESILGCRAPVSQLQYHDRQDGARFTSTR